MKIGIITFHCSYNYGSALQAYALQTYLKKIGCDAKIIDYVDLVNFEDYQLFRRSLYKKKIKSLFGDIYYLLPNYKRKKSFEGFADKYFTLTEKRYTDISSMNELNSEFDTFICGSDQIWNTNCTKGVNPAFFLAFADSSKRKIAYAPSIAEESIDFHKNDEFVGYLKDFDYISVRENSFAPMLSDITGKPVTLAVDPTLLLDKADYEKILTGTSIKGKYIFAYILEENSVLNSFTNTLSQKYNMPVVYIDKKTQHCFKNGINAYGIAPNEWLSLLKNAQFVVTNSFHATVFSVIFSKQFIVFPTEKSGSRMSDFLINLGLDNRLYNESIDIEQKIDFSNSKKICDELSRSSKEFLKNSLDIR